MIPVRCIIPVVPVKCRICKPVHSIDMDKEYAIVQRMMRLADLYRKFEKRVASKKIIGRDFLL